jgi:adenine-specific DNA-methyltransferase
VHEQTKTRTHLDWQGKATEAGAAHPARRSREVDIFDNRLIFGDNLLALKALEGEFTGKVKCVFIDPPYNTGSAFTHYDDGLEHSIWLGLMRDRLEIIQRLLSQDGSLWITIDDNEAHYLKVLCDEILGRVNFVANVIWQKKFAPQNDANLIDINHDQVIVFAKNKRDLSFNLLPRTDEMNARYKNPDNDPRGPWTSDNPLRREFREYAFYEIITPSGRKVLPPPGSSWRFNKEEVPRLISENRLWFGKDGGGVPRIKRFLSDVKDGVIPQTIWLHDQVGNTQEAKKEIIALNEVDIFDTPKPERLIKRVLEIATDPNDLVLDSFAGSGTTGAVAHKMGRRWIMVELGDHCHTHIIPTEKSYRRRGQRRHHRGSELARRWWFPLLQARAEPDRQRPLGQRGHQSRIQRGAPHRGAMQAGGLYLRAFRNAVVAARIFQRARFHLRYHSESFDRAVAGVVG